MFTMEPKKQPELIRQMFNQLKDYREASTNAYLIASTALDLYIKRDEPVNDCIALANIIASIPLRNNEAGFSIYDYMDAVANNQLIPNYRVLIDAFDRQGDDTSDWDNAIITLAEYKRRVYTHGECEDLQQSIIQRLQALGIRN